jgi:hypothetical protein
MRYGTATLKTYVGEDSVLRRRRRTRHVEYSQRGSADAGMKMIRWQSLT